MSARGIPALALLAGLLVGSGVLRAAAEGGHWADMLQSALAPAHATEADGAAHGEEDAFLRSLQRREAELAAMERALAERDRQVQGAERRLRTQVEELERAERALRETLSVATGAADADVTRLVSVYESMRAATAAPLFEAMDPSFAAGFLMRMDPEAAGAILAELSPERGYALSAVMAGRHGGVARD